MRSSGKPASVTVVGPSLLESFKVLSKDEFVKTVTEGRLEDHRIHGERYEVEAEAWERIRAAERVLAVGTTTVRVLETLARGGPLTGRTELFNFHLPRSTLLAMVMAFAGVEETRRLYGIAVEERYRFYSFGDAMLIL